MTKDRLFDANVEVLKAGITALKNERNALRAEVRSLRAEVREWLCEKCKTVYPGPPQPLASCVICPKCNGRTGPRLTLENAALEASRLSAERVGEVEDWMFRGRDGETVTLVEKLRQAMDFGDAMERLAIENNRARDAAESRAEEAEEAEGR